MALQLPERASYEFLKKLAKDRLAILRGRNGAAQLADAQLAIAREYGFASWRDLKREMDRRRAPYVTDFMRACSTGDLDAIGDLLTKDPGLARARLANGTTGLHAAVRHPAAVRLLIEHGADPNVRDLGDNATPLHFAAASGAIESVRALLGAGADVHGDGDLHDGGVIGWASRKGNEAVVDLLLEHGARHHVFSAMALGDRDLVQTIVEEDPEALLRRRSRFENRQTVVHAAFAPPDGLGFLAGAPDYGMLELLLALGADADAVDDKERRPLDVALLRGDRRAIDLLRDAGASESPERKDRTDSAVANTASAVESVRRLSPMLAVANIRETIAWYRAIGFTVHDEYEDSGQVVFARVTLGKGELTLGAGPNPAPRGVSLWFYTDRVEDLYAVLRERQRSSPDGVHVRFDEDLYTPFYGGRQFSIRDVNDVPLVFYQPGWAVPAGGRP
jgi:ankyrin repeat protein